MATEILGFLIIVGILVVFIVRRDLWTGTSSKADEVEEASVKMRLQMEHSANAIITQMDSRIHQLEGLVSAADERARTLEQQMATVRAEQERAQQRAEKEFAEMRAARASFYAPRDEYVMPAYHNGMRGRDAWAVRDEYRERVAATGRSLRPIDGVSPVRRFEYASRVQPASRESGVDFAETLSASMYEEEAGNGAYRRAQEDHYDRGRPHVYTQAYPTEAYPEEDPWEQYVEQPRRTTLPEGNHRSRRAQAIPAELAVEETPAVIVDAQMASRQNDPYLREEPEENEPVFSQEQLKELARTEAEVVVSSSVADVVDLPLDSEEEDATYDGSDDEEDVHAYVETDEDDTDTLNATLSESDQNVAEANEFSQEEDESSEWSEEKALFANESEPTSPAGGETSLLTAEEDDISDSVAEASVETEALDVEEGISPETSAVTDETESYETEEDTWATSFTDDYTMLTDEEDSAEAEDIESSVKFSPSSSSPTSWAKELLARGMPPKAVARKTGLGQRAVELLAQMAKGELNSQADD